MFSRVRPFKAPFISDSSDICYSGIMILADLAKMQTSSSSELDRK